MFGKIIIFLINMFGKIVIFLINMFGKIVIFLIHLFGEIRKLALERCEGLCTLNYSFAGELYKEFCFFLDIYLNSVVIL